MNQLFRTSSWLPYARPFYQRFKRLHLHNETTYQQAGSIFSRFRRQLLWQSVGESISLPVLVLYITGNIAYTPIAGHRYTLFRSGCHISLPLFWMGRASSYVLASLLLSKCFEWRSEDFILVFLHFWSRIYSVETSYRRQMLVYYPPVPFVLLLFCTSGPKMMYPFYL